MKSRAKREEVQTWTGDVSGVMNVNQKSRKGVDKATVGAQE